ncbi:proliferating cell nuclear antigen PCNA [Caldisphaera lagunensis DSM 15908]|uniref:DNA polymerase sliding clamp n=1 Tax=Caldisphaera lagunensis (strain DSM 15908 / JCM 11604 / ANMR 0165 / IC-154) TaxID=1056495 RepID=L0AAW6_CALLD|nr:proliferating cell nuclear antigen PCNA [Caldisphaera lagunensis DSM 15908]
MKIVKIKFKEPRTWRYIIGSIEKIIDEGVFTINEEGLHFRALDTSRIVMIDFIYPKSSFEEFDVDKEENIGVSFSTLSDILKRAEKDDELEMISDENSITLKYIGKGERLFKIPQISLSQDKLPEPKITFTVKAKLTNNTFIDIINDIEAIGESITIRADDNENKLIITGKGDIESAEIELSLEKQNLIELSIDSPDSSTYSIEYLSDMLMAAKEADLITLMYSQDAPAKIDMEYQNGGRITFYISPRID